MGPIYAIMLNTFREAVRDRVLYAVLGFACAVLLFTLAIAELSLHDELRVVSDVGLASISLFSVMIAVFLGSSLLYKEIERKTLYVILPKPIARAEFLLGKYLGIVLTAVVFVALMGSLQLWLTALQAGVSPLVALLVLLALAGTLGAGLSFARDRTAILVPFAALA
ncbi:MAG TPA: ABC transporter permease subunit, partial [Polyangiales bacterium]|nr:ABC transporter permease subunit [Polyangiales bacterium]